MPSVKPQGPRQTSILNQPAANSNGKGGGFVGPAQSAELHPVPPFHLDPQEPTPERLQKQMLDGFETLRRGTLAMRQNPASSPCHSRGVTTTASPQQPTFVLVPHALGRPYTGVHCCRHQGSSWAGYEVSQGQVGFATISAGGQGYTSPPAVSFTGGGGSGASGYAVLVNGAVDHIVLTSSGTGYTGTPQVVLTGGQDTTATTNITASATVTMPPAFDPSQHVQLVSRSTGTFDFHIWGD